MQLKKVLKTKEIKMIKNLREDKLFNPDGTLTGSGIKANKERISKESSRAVKRSKRKSYSRSYSRPTKFRGFNFYDMGIDNFNDETELSINQEEQILEEARERNYENKEVDKNVYDKD